MNGMSCPAREDPRTPLGISGRTSELYECHECLVAAAGTVAPWSPLYSVLSRVPSQKKKCKMGKRRRPDDDDVVGRSVKKSRTGSRRNLLDISDEILLRVLSFLPIKDLLRTES